MHVNAGTSSGIRSLLVSDIDVQDADLSPGSWDAEARPMGTSTGAGDGAASALPSALLGADLEARIASLDGILSAYTSASSSPLSSPKAHLARIRQEWRHPWVSPPLPPGNDQEQTISSSHANSGSDDERVKPMHSARNHATVRQFKGSKVGAASLGTCASTSSAPPEELQSLRLANGGSKGRPSPPEAVFTGEVSNQGFDDVQWASLEGMADRLEALVSQGGPDEFSRGSELSSSRGIESIMSPQEARNTEDIEGLSEGRTDSSLGSDDVDARIAEGGRKAAGRDADTSMSVQTDTANTS